MAVYDLEEQEQLAQLKAWWAQYGNGIVTVLLVLAVGFAGWQGWGRYKNSKAADASAMYFELQKVAETSNPQQTSKIAGEIIEKYGDTVQAQLAALLSAGIQFRDNEFGSAQLQLEWAADKGKDAALRDLARLRLAALLLQQGSADKALERLQPVPDLPWRARFEDLRGDALVVLGRAAEARTAWQSALGALDSMGGNDGLRTTIRIKLESLEG